MCGFAGIAWLDGREPDGVEARVTRMTGRIRHRGPDSEGLIRTRESCVGFRRLAILDLAGGDQPVSNESGSVQAFLNGEIYNHLELRQELERRGHRLRSRSDAEILPHLYEEHGLEFLTLLNGMFALYLHDAERRVSYLCRDRLGIKPLFHAEHEGRLVFGSELKTVLASGLVPRALDERQILVFLDTFTSPGAETLAQGVRRLLPGEVLSFGPQRSAETHRYYSLPVSAAAQTRPPSVEELDALLEDSLRLQLVADVPVGISLSGGLDSSLMTLYAARQPSVDLRLFTIHFPSTPREELASAEAVAAQYGLEHVVVSASTDDFLAHAPRMAWFNDEPVADPAFYSAMKVAEAAAQANIKVLLAGTGADELFAGYGHHRLTRKKALCTHLPGGLVRTRLARALLGRPQDELAALADYRRSRLGWHALAMSSLQAEERATLRAHLATSRDPLSALRAAFGASAHADPLDQQLYADTVTYLPDQLLPVLDRSTMAASIEGRVPYLDHRLCEAAFRIHAGAKLGPHGDTPKALLRALAGGLPPGILTRKKIGFPNAVEDWLESGLYDCLATVFEARGSFAREYLPREWVRELVRSPAAARSHWRVVYSLLLLQLWFELFVRNDLECAPDVGLVEFARGSG